MARSLARHLSLFIIPAVLGSPLCSLVPPQSAAAQSLGSSSSGSNSSDEIVAAAWYAGWHGTDFTPQNVSWSKYTQVTYAFATTTPDSSTLSLADSDEELLPTFVSLAHQNGVKASLSIGGWTGSQYYSTAVATSDNRTAFTKAILGLVSQYNLDGIDFDWEYPNRQGVGCNVISPNDSSNFLSLLQEIRADPAGSNLTLSAAVGLTPFMGPDSTPLDDVSQFAKSLDFISVMNYDVWGTWTPSGVGPNAPLNDSCVPSSEQEGSAVSAVAAWTSANFPASQIVLGVGSYGHSFSVTQTDALASNGSMNPYPAFDASNQPHGDSWDGDAGVDQCGNPTPIGGIFDFWGLVDGGFLNTNGTAASGISYRYDGCSQTPYVYNPSSQVMVSYDDATSFAAKGDYINEAGLAGFAMWEAGGDYNDILLDAIREAIGSDEDC